MRKAGPECTATAGCWCKILALSLPSELVPAPCASKLHRLAKHDGTAGGRRVRVFESAPANEGWREEGGGLGCWSSCSYLRSPFFYAFTLPFLFSSPSPRSFYLFFLLDFLLVFFFFPLAPPFLASGYTHSSWRFALLFNLSSLTSLARSRCVPFFSCFPLIGACVYSSRRFA